MNNFNLAMPDDSESLAKKCFYLQGLNSSGSSGTVLHVDTGTQSSALNCVAFGENYEVSATHENMKYIEINNLINFNYSLKRPIEVKIITNIFGEVIGDIEELELYSFGNDEFEVLRELNEDLTDLFEELINLRNENLGKYPKKWKKLLKKYIGKAI